MLSKLFKGYTREEIERGTDRLLDAIKALPPASKAGPKVIRHSSHVTLDHYEADGFPSPESICDL